METTKLNVNDRANAYSDIPAVRKRKHKPGYIGYVDVRTEPKIQPNSKCPCGSGKKYKYCCG